MSSNTTLIDRLRFLRQFVAPVSLELPNFDHSLIVVRRTPQGYSYTEIQPRPKIQNLSPKLIQKLKSQGIQVEVDDLQVAGIGMPRSDGSGYRYEDLIGQGFHYLLGAEMVSGVPEGGSLADWVQGTVEDRVLTWSLVIRRRR